MKRTRSRGTFVVVFAIATSGLGCLAASSPEDEVVDPIDEARESDDVEGQKCCRRPKPRKPIPDPGPYRPPPAPRPGKGKPG
jgi:hypothetical protein